jgi:hypothetical protein
MKVHGVGRCDDGTRRKRLSNREEEVMLACLASLALAAGIPEAPPSGAPDVRLPLPAPSGSLVFEPGTTEIGLEELLRRLANLTGQELAMTQQTRQILAQVKEPLESATPVPKEEVYTFIEGLLARQDFLIAPVSGGTRPILGVQVAGDNRMTQLAPLYVHADAMTELAAHPALLVRLLINFEHTDSRQVQTQIRQLQTDSGGVTQVVPVGERGLILQGRASEMASLARLLLDADEAAGMRPALAPKAEGKEE